MNTRLLGAICVIGSMVVVLDSARKLLMDPGSTTSMDTFGLMTMAIWAIGCIAGLLGMIRLNVLGSNPVVRALGFVPIIGFVLLILANILQIAGMFTTDTNTPAGIGWMVQLSGMVLVAILTIAAKVWSGWRRFVPLLTIGMVPIAFGLGSTLGNLMVGAAIIYATWVLLGFVVATSESFAAQQKITTV